MKKLHLTAVLLFFFSLFTTTTQAQFLKKIQKAASRGMEQAIEDKVEEEANKYVQRQLEKQLAGLFPEEGESTPVTLDMNKILSGLGEDVATEEAYMFKGSSKIEIQSTDKNGKGEDPLFLKSFMTQGENYTAMELENPDEKDGVIVMIFDMDNQASILLMDNDGQKSSFAYKLDLMSVTSDQQEAIEMEMENNEFSVEKTGNTKDILGYPCEEYAVKSKDGEGTYWVTQEPIEGYASFWGKNSPFVTTKTQQTYSEQFANLPEGNFMEMNFNSTDGTNTMMKVLEINLSDEHTFTMSEYPNLMTQYQNQ
ncbi:DUF4412 domain-containing protein [Algoriphagus namhaensis]|uniref:DUF4412 domain-containing protein n=1 Tax=Algoriphagus namhaensis TaxID=915353 RepID=A0ABV8AWB9_9BACT